MSISEETNWIYNQLRFVPPFNKRETGTSEEGNELPIDKDDIMRFLDLMHVQKLDVSTYSESVGTFICLFFLMNFPF